MSVIDQVYQETRRLAVAGSNLAADDFRLKKLVPLLRKASEKAPIFGRLADASEELLASKSANSADKLLELSSMVTAIRYTQGQTGIEGKLQPLPKSDLELKPTRTSARVLKPLLDALTSTGSGRLEIICDAYERGLFNDLRLVTPAITAIDDVYGEIGDFIAEKVLRIYGPSIYPRLESGFDLKGKTGAARRLKLMHRLDPDRAQPLVDEALESGSKEVKLAAIACLKGNPKAIGPLIDQANSKIKDVRLAALRSMAEMDKPEIIDALIKALSGNDAGDLANHVRRNRSKKLKSFLLEELNRLLDTSLKTKDAKARDKNLTRLRELLPTIRRASDKDTIAFLARVYDEKSKLEKLKGTHTDGNDILLSVTYLISECENKALQKRVVEDVSEMSPQLFMACFHISLAHESTAAHFDRFSPYYVGEVKKGRKTKDAQKSEALRNLLAIAASPRSYNPYFHDSYMYGIAEDEDRSPKKLDDRWLDMAVEHKDQDLVMALARPNHKPTQAFLAEAFAKSLSGRSWYHSVCQIIEVMIGTQDPATVPSMVAAIEKFNQSDQRSFWWFERILAIAPPEAAEPIEAMLPSLNEKLVDAIVPHLTEMKART